MWTYFLLAKYYRIKSIYRFTKIYLPKGLWLSIELSTSQDHKTSFPRVHDQRSLHSTFFRHDVRKWVGNPPVQDIPDWSLVRVYVFLKISSVYFFGSEIFSWITISRMRARVIWMGVAGGPDPAFSLLLYVNPASRIPHLLTSLSRIPFFVSKKNTLKETNFVQKLTNL